MKANSKVDLPMPDGPTRQMWLALTRNNIDELRSALLAGADPNDPDKNGLAPVMVAAMLRNVEMVRLLSTHGAAYPSKAKGQWFNAYFDTLTPWYNSDALWSAEQVAVHWEDFELLEVVLALPGTLAALAPQGTIYPTGSYACAAFERFENVGCSRFLEEVIRAVAVESLASASSLSNAERSLVRRAITRFLMPQAIRYGASGSFTLHCASEPIYDALGADEELNVRALFFNFEFANDMRELPPGTGQVTSRVRKGNPEEAVKAGILPLSPNVSVRLQTFRVDYQDEDTIDPVDGKAYPGAYYSSEWLSGTVFFSTDASALNRYLLKLGTPELALELWDALREDSYERVKAAIEAGADRTMSHSEGQTVDTWAAGAGKPNALRAILECDPISRTRLARSSFTLGSPLVSAIKNRLGYKARSRLDRIFLPSSEPSPAWIDDDEHGPSEDTERISAAMMLIDAGCNVQAVDLQLPASPLEVACVAGPLELVSALLDAGADPSSIFEGASPVCVHISEQMKRHLQLWAQNR